jgi:Zn-finger protein
MPYPREKYTDQHEGEWVPQRRRRHFEQCCDCGLIHRLNYRIRSGRIEQQAFRDERRTAGVRRVKQVKT